MTCDPPQEILPTSETNLRRETMTPEWTEGSAEASPPLPQPTMAQLASFISSALLGVFFTTRVTWEVPSASQLLSN